ATGTRNAHKASGGVRGAARCSPSYLLRQLLGTVSCHAGWRLDFRHLCANERRADRRGRLRCTDRRHRQRYDQRPPERQAGRPGRL
ncbi:MAG: hypothetical protein AVDCRST_MAG25-2446, partial [uncultured Rubrobacteraceae bacterium]